MRLWKQRNSTAVQLFATMAHLPPEFLASIPTLPHAAERLNKEKFNTDQQRRDVEEDLTPEILGIPVQPPVPPEESTEPTLLPATEIQFMSKQITGIKVQRGRRSLKKKPTTAPTVAPASVVSAPEAPAIDPYINTDLSNSPISRLILRVLRYKRRIISKTLTTITTPSPVSTGTVVADNQISTVSEQQVVIVDPTTITSPARLAGGMRIHAQPKRPPKRSRVDELTNINHKRANINSSSTELTLSTSTSVVSVSQPSSPGDIPTPSSKRKCPSSETLSTTSPKRHRSSERQEVFKLKPSSNGKNSSTDNIDLRNIDLPSIDFNVCALTESANGDSPGDLLAKVPMEVGKDIFNFTSNVVFITPADNVSGMEFASVVLPILDTNVCVLASPVALELASAID